MASFLFVVTLYRYAEIFNATRLLLPLPPPRVGVPNAVGEQAIQIGEIWVTAVVEGQAFAIFFARPPTRPHLPSRIIRVEVRTAKCRPAAMRTTFNVAAVAMAFADRCAAIRAGSKRLIHEYLSCTLRLTLVSSEFLGPHRRPLSRACLGPDVLVA
jgi:hypothetical protein